MKPVTTNHTPKTKTYISPDLPSYGTFSALKYYNLDVDYIDPTNEVVNKIIHINQEEM